MPSGLWELGMMPRAVLYCRSKRGGMMKKPDKKRQSIATKDSMSRAQLNPSKPYFQSRGNLQHGEDHTLILWRPRVHIQTVVGTRDTSGATALTNSCCC